MADTFVWDLGFDFNAIQASDTQSYLQSGLVRLSDGQLALQSLTIGELIRFNVYNVTSGATLSDYSISGAEITFTNALKGNESNPCPFDSSAQVVTGGGFGRITIGPLGLTTSKGQSTIFGPNLPLWSNLVGVDLPVKNKGKFLMTIALIVQGASGLPRTFVVDPEMIVGGAT